MKTSDFYFDLPQDLIAQKPSGKRGEDRLMLLNRTTGIIEHHKMQDLPTLIDEGTVMVFNNSKVRRSRCYGIKTSSGRETEFMFLSRCDAEGKSWKCMVKGAKKVKPGNIFKFLDGSEGIVSDDGTRSEFRVITFPFSLTEDWFEKNGHIPLPPYIRREDTEVDTERYQTVYAKETGSAACPTAGLHFTEQMLETLSKRGIDLLEVTLHVGLGTFLPVRSTEIEEHKMHEESYTVSSEVAEKINAAKREGRTILAVGTTSVRTLESATSSDGILKAGEGSTHIFMYPGYKFKIVDQMFTNFHTPESTLIMLVSAFAGRENILNAYNVAVKERYRFFSYGDAMFIKNF